MIFFRRIGHTFRVASVGFDGAHLGEDLIYRDGRSAEFDLLAGCRQLPEYRDVSV
jgi:hypothetical protein